MRKLITPVLVWCGNHPNKTITSSKRSLVMWVYLTWFYYMYGPPNGSCVITPDFARLSKICHTFTQISSYVSHLIPCMINFRLLRWNNNSNWSLMLSCLSQLGCDVDWFSPEELHKKYMTPNLSMVDLMNEMHLASKKVCFFDPRLNDGFPFQVVLWPYHASLIYIVNIRWFCYFKYQRVIFKRTHVECYT